MNRTALASLSLGAFALLASACAPDEPQPRAAIVASVPWTESETLRYDLVERGGEIYGRCVLTTDPEVSPGVTRLSHLCADTTEQQRDDRVTEVTSDTLTPLSAERTIRNLEKGTTTIYTSTYSGNEVQLSARVENNVNDTSRTLPEANEDVPNPTWYDDESLFWIMRSVPLQAGFEQTYTNLNAANGQVFDVRVSVEGQEEVTVTAGTFTAWRIRIQTDSVVQEFFVDAEAPHRVVYARIERINYELTAIEPGAD